MKTITLKSLALDGFQGGKDTITPDGGDINVYAKNGLGKTRLASAYSWVTTDKDSLGRPTFEKKNINLDGSYDAEATVETVLSIDGQLVTLKKTFAEKHSGERGKAEKKMTGNENIYWINDSVATATEFNAFLREAICDEELLSLLSNPTAFATMSDQKGTPGWKRRRAILMTVCGNVTDAEIIESDTRLAPLTDLLKRFTVSTTPVDDLKKSLKTQKADTVKLRDQVPIQIKENKRMLPDITDLDQTACMIAVQTAEGNLNDVKARLHGVDNGSSIAPLAKTLEGIKADLRQLEQDHYNAATIRLNKLNAQIREITEASEGVKRQRTSINGDIVSKAKRLEDIGADLTKLREKWTGINDEQFQDTTEKVCPACDQALPEDRVEAAREKALASFNRDKAERLEAVNREGQRLSGDKNRTEGEINGLKRALSDLEDKDISALEELTAERDALRQVAEDYTLIPGYEDLVTQKALVDGEIRGAREGVAEDRGKLEAEVQEYEAVLKDAREKANRFTDRKKGEKRIRELDAEEKKYAKQIEEMERQIFLCELFTTTKVAMLDSKINSKFKIARFKLFQKNIGNEGIEDCCEVTDAKGVPFNGGLNNGARTRIGLDICNTLQQHYKIRVPVFIDTAGEVTSWSDLDMECQVIRLFASEGRWLPEGHPDIQARIGSLESKIEGGVTFYFIPDDKLRIERVETKGKDTLFGRAVA